MWAPIVLIVVVFGGLWAVDWIEKLDPLKIGVDELVERSLRQPKARSTRGRWTA